MRSPPRFSALDTGTTEGGNDHGWGKVFEDLAARGVRSSFKKDDVIDLLPPEAARRLQDLRDREADASAAHAVVSQALAEARSLRQAAAGRVAQLTDRETAERYGTEIAHEGHPSVVAARAELDRAEAEVARLTARQSEIAARRWQRGLRNIEEYLEAVNGITLAMHAGPVEVKVGKEKGAVGAIEAARAQLASLRADLREVAAAPIKSGAAKAKIREEVEELARLGRPDVLRVIETGRRIGWPMVTPNNYRAAVSNDGEARIAGFFLDTPSLFFWLHRDQLLARLLEDVEHLKNDEAALGDVDRARRTAEILARILQIERTDVALVDAARAEGRNIQYRDETDPRALLHLASDVPGPGQ